ncbi:anthranilate synthase component I [Arenibaculum pallidiluteum]|uniref:anthranilate synthase component I n=1 Tax=Arenibaculum pallidiluteum TaxID=2812559 RepID=UPI001A96C001|nr:anthranilate synthase component I [Arenibaculum pallidiluteum]
MKVRPDAAAFAATYRRGAPQVVWTELVSDLDTPVSALVKLADGQPNSFLLESVTGGEVRGRYSFIGLKPDLIWRCRHGKAEINRRARVEPEAFEPCGEAPLQALRSLLAESRIDLPEELPPMAAGLFGYLGYDMIRLIERLPDDNPDPMDVPDAILIRPTIIAVFDGIRNLVTLVTPVRPQAELSAEQAYILAQERLADAVADMERGLPRPVAPAASDVGPLPQPGSDTTREEFLAMVEQGKEYIRAGDVFQVVLSQRFDLPFRLPPLALYRALRRLNPSPFLVYLDFGGHSIVGSSPEILVRLRDGKVTIRPLAGTRPRGATPDEDRSLATGLLADPKELAEHLMLLDLGRNDVGRVARPGTVTVTEKMVVEYYSHVMHIVSNVEGEIDPAHDVVDALFGGFPAGTVSGAPKVRAMEIIDELEKSRRGVYGGCVGYFGASGAMDTCITLRTAVLKDGRLYIQAGAGIVADSDPATEYEETVNKAKALVRAAEEAVRFASGRG